MYTFGNLDLGGDIEVFNDGLGWFHEEKDVKLKAKQNGSGVAGILGIHMKPTDALTIALRAETLTKINVTTTQVEDTADIIEERHQPERYRANHRMGLRLPSERPMEHSKLGRLLLQYLCRIWPTSWVRRLGRYQGRLGNRLGTRFKVPRHSAFNRRSLFKSGFTEEIRTSNRFSMDALFVGAGAKLACLALVDYRGGWA